MASLDSGIGTYGNEILGTNGDAESSTHPVVISELRVGIGVGGGHGCVGLGDSGLSLGQNLKQEKEGITDAFERGRCSEYLLDWTPAIYVKGGNKYNKLFWIATIAPLISAILSTFIVFINHPEEEGVQICSEVLRCW